MERRRDNTKLRSDSSAACRLEHSISCPTRYSKVLTLGKSQILLLQPGWKFSYEWNQTKCSKTSEQPSAVWQEDLNLFAPRVKPTAIFNNTHIHVKFNSSIRSNTHLSTEKTRAIFPIARILFLITSFLTAGVPPERHQQRQKQKTIRKTHDHNKESVWTSVLLFFSGSCFGNLSLQINNLCYKSVTVDKNV